MSDSSSTESRASQNSIDFEREVLSAFRQSQSRFQEMRIGKSIDSSYDALLVSGEDRIAVEIKYSANTLKQTATQAARVADRARRAAGPEASAMLILGGEFEQLYAKGVVESDDHFRAIIHAAFRARGFDFLIIKGAGYSTEVFVAWKNIRGKSEFRWVGSFSDAVSLCLANVRNFADNERSKAAVDEPKMDFRPSYEAFLLVGSEWSTSKGGISSFNLELAKALLGAGKRVCVAVPTVTDKEISEAQSLNIELAISKRSVPGIVGLPALLTGVRFLGKSFIPDVIVGHGRILGPYAASLQSEFSRSPKRIHIVHMDPEALERAKEGDLGKPRTQIAAERKKLESELALTATVVAGVGPRLTNWINDVVNARAVADSPPVVEIIPGLRDWGSRRTSLPIQKTFLFTGRVEDFDSKGVGLAIEAMILARTKRPYLNSSLKLVIRGVPTEHAALSSRINELKKDSDLDVVLREYTTDPADLRADLFEASAVLMPSLHEGFGLSAYEAIAADIPVIVSNKSGLGDLISSMQSSQAPPSNVIEVGTPGSAAKWADAICSIIDDPRSANLLASKLRQEIDSQDYWRLTIERLLKALN